MNTRRGPPVAIDNDQLLAALLALLAGETAGLTAEAIEELARQGCSFSAGPAGPHLESVGLGWYRDIIGHVSRAERWSIGRSVLVYRQTASTNDICWQLAAGLQAHGTVVLADEQTRGRGRRGAPWAARAGQSILLSLLLLDVPDANLDQLTLLLGLACAEAIDASAGKRAQIKWPNDVLLDGRKVAGVLVEARPIGEGRRAVVLGVGLNVRQAKSDFPAELTGRATSLYQATGRQIDRLDLVLMLLRQIERWCITPPIGWLAAWKARCAMLGTEITARSGARTLRGLVIDVDPLAGLIVRDALGATHLISARTSTLSPEC